MGWLLLFLVLAHQQGSAPHRLPTPPDLTVQMWVGIVMGVILSIPLWPIAWRVGQRAGERLFGQRAVPDRGPAGTGE